MRWLVTARRWVVAQVAKIERGQEEGQHGRCFGFLSDATRFSLRVHRFVGGFDAECVELFGTLERKAREYKRLVEPDWLGEERGDATQAVEEEH
jgi:hypothetical protein